MCYTALFFYHIFPEKVKGKMEGKGKSPSECSDGDLLYPENHWLGQWFQKA